MNQATGGALTGDLEALGLPDVLQVLALGNKTGALQVESDGRQVTLYFEKGQVVGAHEIGQCRRPLNQLLETSGRLNEEQAQRIRELRSQYPDRIDLILVEMGVIGRPIWEQHQRLAIAESVCHVLQWRAGQYRFELGRHTPERSAAPCNVANLVLEGLRAVDEWQMLSDKIPCLEAVPKQVDGLSSETKPLGIGALESRVLSRCNGQNTIRALAELLLINELEVARAVYSMISSGLVAIIGIAPSPPPPASLAVDEHPVAEDLEVQTQTIDLREITDRNGSAETKTVSSGSELGHIISQLVEQAQQASQQRQQEVGRQIRSMLDQSLDSISAPVKEMPRLRFLSVSESTETVQSEMETIVAATVNASNALLAHLEDYRLQEGASSSVEGQDTLREEFGRECTALFARVEKSCPALGAVQIVERRLDTKDLVATYTLVGGEARRLFYQEAIQGLVELLETLLEKILQTELSLASAAESCRTFWQQRKPLIQARLDRMIALQAAEDQRIWDATHRRRK